MKKLIIAAAALMVSVAAYGQGQFVFNNRLLPTVEAKFVLPTDTGGTSSLAGDAFSVQVLAGPQGGTLAPVGSTTFRSGAAAGFVNAITPAVPGLTDGQTASVQLRFFQGAAGTGTLLGELGPYNVVVHTAPATPVALGLGTSPITVPVIPEPSTFALAALGLGALLAIRRRK
jgi:hypothetical protein